ncbi:E3 ubiquitin-protein ligase RHA2B-like [Salvia hispanica]|uniref:E3 ubiquitin-protein ligase RHA2B-like n=1 Tax=Salvia hispanica TaxID=49212 RepID=UPI002009B5D9|nr:E3 ubiquitin-protein ligase RHA2B-like [Salvia hispanica]
MLGFLDEILADFMVEILPKLFRLMVLSIVILSKQCKHISLSYKYSSIINKKTSNFAISNHPNWKECSVCLSEFEQGDEAMEVVDCRHVFHHSCLEKWLRWHRGTCPLCRSVVVPDVVVREYHRARMDRESDGIQKELAIILFNVLHGGSCRHGFF